MPLTNLARRLSAPGRIGLTPSLAARLGVPDEAAARAALDGMARGGAGPLGVYLLGAYVVDDTDFWDDGGIYWWCVPVVLRDGGQARWSPLSGLPTGFPPHRVGSHEWMTSLSLQKPPLLAVIPPGDDVAACVMRLAVYDDDAAPVDLPAALAAGLEALAGCAEPAPPDQILGPAAAAIRARADAAHDDLLLDQDVTIRRGHAGGFAVGLVGAVTNEMIRVYYFVRDEVRTEQAGPIVLQRGQEARLSFRGPLEPGGRVAIFSRGADVATDVLGDLSVESPFVDRVLDAALASALSRGVGLTGSGPARVVAYYTPPPRV